MDLATQKMSAKDLVGLFNVVRSIYSHQLQTISLLEVLLYLIFSDKFYIYALKF